MVALQRLLWYGCSIPVKEGAPSESGTIWGVRPPLWEIGGHLHCPKPHGD